jgi:hypothetical protein
MGDIGECFKVGGYLATLLSNKLLDLSIILIASENEAKSSGDDSDNEVIPASYPNRSTSI